MPTVPTDLAARADNLRSILFTEFTAVAVVLGLVVAAAGRRL